METSLPMDFTVNYGVRYTWVNSKLSKASASLNGFDRNGQYKNFDDGSAGKTGSDRNSRPVFNLSLNWTGLPDTSLRAGWSQGFRVPNLQEKYLMNSMGGRNDLWEIRTLSPRSPTTLKLGPVMQEALLRQTSLCSTTSRMTTFLLFVSIPMLVRNLSTPTRMPTRLKPSVPNSP